MFDSVVIALVSLETGAGGGGGLTKRAEVGTLGLVMQATYDSPQRLLSHMALLSSNLDSRERKLRSISPH